VKQDVYKRFLRCVEQWPDAIAVEIRSTPPEKFTYQRLRFMAESVGRWLSENGHPPATACAIFASNSPRWVAAYLGTIAVGCIVVPLDASLHADELSRLLTASDAKLLFSDSLHWATVQKVLTGHPLPVVLLDSSSATTDFAPTTSRPVYLDSVLDAGAGNFTPVSATPGATAAILFTSGTTDFPMGVVLTHENLTAQIEAVFGRLQAGPGDAILSVLPLFHALPQTANLLLPLACGARIVYLETLNTSELLRALRECDITVFCCVPQFFYLIHERIFKEVTNRGGAVRLGFTFLLRLCRVARTLGLDPGKLFFRSIHQMLGSKMRYLISGGARFDPKIGKDFYALGFNILQGYGLTETAGSATCTSPGKNVIGSVGPPLPGVEIKILGTTTDENGSGQYVGEIAIRGTVVMAGYYNRPDATATVLQDGWLRTGDLGYFDDSGNLFIAGRKKDVIVLCSGKNIYPEDIEQHYLKSPFIKGICVLGLESQHGEPFAERLHAVIVPNFELMRERKIVNTKEVLRFDLEGLSAQIPASKRILSYEIWQCDLPRTTTGKLKRFEIAKAVRQRHEALSAQMPMRPTSETQLSPGDQLWLLQPEVQHALKVISSVRRSYSSPIHPRDNLELDLGLDSLQRVELLVELKEELGIRVPESAISEVYTVRELVDLVLEATLSGPTAPRSSARSIAWESVLHHVAPEPEVLAATRRRPVLDAVGFLLACLVRLFARHCFDLRVSGLGNLPANGPFIIAPNHQSFLDPLGVGIVLPWHVFRDIFFLGSTDIFNSKLMHRAAQLFKVIPVNPDASLVPAMRAGAYGLRCGKVLLLYPEGERSIDGTPKIFKKGAAILATHLAVPIVPAAVDGFFDVWPRGKSYQGFAPVRITFASPIYPPKGAPSSEAAYDCLTDELKRRVVEAWTKLHADMSQTSDAQTSLRASRTDR
jgi:long-chain acyl-CoA synthetase